MDSLEELLKRQPFRAPPPDLRAEILAAATAALPATLANTARPLTAATSAQSTTAPSASSSPPSPQPWWRLWLWPSPYAWAALAATWLVIIGIAIAAAQADRRLDSHSPDLRPDQILASLAARRREMELVLQPNPPAASNSAATPDLHPGQPRASLEPRRCTQTILS